MGIFNEMNNKPNIYSILTEEKLKEVLDNLWVNKVVETKRQLVLYTGEWGMNI